MSKSRIISLDAPKGYIITEAVIHDDEVIAVCMPKERKVIKGFSNAK